MWNHVNASTKNASETHGVSPSSKASPSMDDWQRTKDGLGQQPARQPASPPASQPAASLLYVCNVLRTSYMLKTDLLQHESVRQVKHKNGGGFNIEVFDYEWSHKAKSGWKHNIFFKLGVVILPLALCWKPNWKKPFQTHNKINPCFRQKSPK